MGETLQEGERKSTTYGEASSIFESWMQSEGATEAEAREACTEALKNCRRGRGNWYTLTQAERVLWSRLYRLGIDPKTFRPLKESGRKKW